MRGPVKHFEEVMADVFQEAMERIRRELPPRPPFWRRLPSPREILWRIHAIFSGRRE